MTINLKMFFLSLIQSITIYVTFIFNKYLCLCKLALFLKDQWFITGDMLQSPVSLFLSCLVLSLHVMFVLSRLIFSWWLWDSFCHLEVRCARVLLETSVPFALSVSKQLCTSDQLMLSLSPAWCARRLACLMECLCLGLLAVPSWHWCAVWGESLALTASFTSWSTKARNRFCRYRCLKKNGLVMAVAILRKTPWSDGLLLEAEHLRPGAAATNYWYKIELCGTTARYNYALQQRAIRSCSCKSPAVFSLPSGPEPPTVSGHHGEQYKNNRRDNSKISRSKF